jgi:hypothetical protein
MVLGLVVLIMWGVVWGLSVELEMPRHPEPDLVQVRQQEQVYFYFLLHFF